MRTLKSKSKSRKSPKRASMKSKSPSRKSLSSTPRSSSRKHLTKKHAKAKAARGKPKKSPKRDMKKSEHLQQPRRSGEDMVPLKKNIVSKAIDDVFTARGAGHEASRLNILTGEVERSRKASIDRSREQTQVGPISPDEAAKRQTAGNQPGPLPAGRRNDH